MANEEVRALLVRVNATTELLRSNLIAAEREVSRFSQSVERQGARVNSTFQRVGQSAGAQRAGLQQLSFQIGDIATQYAMGTRPMQIFAQQSGQVLQAVQMTMGGTSRFAAFLGGPWGALITAGVVALTPFISKLFETEGAANAARTALEGMIEARRRDLIEQNKLGLAGRQMAGDAARARQLEAEIARASGGRRQADGTPMFAYRQQQELNEIRARMAEGRAAISWERGQQRERGLSGWERVATVKPERPARAKRERQPRAGKKPDVFDPVELAKDTTAALINMSAEFEQRMGEAAEEYLKDQLEIAGRVHDANVEFAEQAAEKARRIGETQIDFLSNLFERAFQGGTKAIWRDFKDIGLGVISQLLARFALAKVSGGGFDFGSALSATLGSVLGFADGGRPPVGRPSIVGERGPELFVPDVAGTVVPNGGFDGGGVAVTINAPGATAETVMMIRREIMNASPALIAAAQSRTTRSLSRARI